jgi:pyroglutamyl-peptidase
MTKHPMILVTAFEPYDGSHLNPSEQVLKKLPRNINSVNLRKVILACDSLHTPPYITELASDPLINMVVILGEDRRYALPTMERFAYNWLHYDVPDNLGHQPMNRSIEDHGPELLETSIDVAAIRLALANKGTRVNVSEDPGRHLCNHVYFEVRYHTDPKPVLLLHLPRLPEQQAYPSMRLADTRNATFEILAFLSSLIHS